MGRNWMALLLVWVVTSGWGVAWAQEAATAGLDLRPGAGRAGTGFYSPGDWNLVRTTAVNETRVEQTPLLTISLEGNRDAQFTKRLWLPPQTQLTTLTPVRLTEMPEGEKRGVEAYAQLMTIVDGREVRATDPDIGALPIREGGLETALFSGAEGDQTTDLLAALRAAANLSPTTAYIADTNAPTLAAAWDNIDVLVISRESPDLTTEQIEAMRRWVVGGGRLWINLQEVDPAFPRRLLGHAWNVSILDRVDLHEFELTFDRGRSGGETQQVVISRDYPIEFVRVVAPDMTVTHSVNGYPAALRKPIGNGTLLVTTLEAPAWLADDEAANPALADLGWLLRRERGEPSGIGDEILAELATQQIGKSVMARTPVMAVLGVFTLALLGSGLWLAQRGDLARMAWVAPVLSVLAAGVVLGLGLAQQSEVPYTLATSQRVEALPGEPYAQVDALVSVYTPRGADEAQLAGVGPIAWPDLTHHSSPVRLVWTPAGTWSYQGLRFPENAVLNTRVDAVAPLGVPAEAVVTFTDEGVEGRVIAGPLGEIEDPVMMTASGKLSPSQTGEDGAFIGGYVDPLGPDQYYPGSVLGQRELARQAIYRALAADPRFPTRPVLVGWSDGVDLGVSVAEAATPKREALVILPLRFEPPAAGAEVRVPSALLSMRRFTGDTETTGSPIFDERTREWVPNITQAQTVLMAFELPPGLEEIESTGGRIVMELDTPDRPYEVVVYRGGEVVSVASGTEANGRIVTELTPATAPDVNEEGVAAIGVRVGEPMTASNQPPSWSLSRLELSLTGRMAEDNPEIERAEGNE